MRSETGGTLAGSRACLNQPPIFLTSVMAEPAIAAPKVPPKTRIIGGSSTMAMGLEPSMIIMKSSDATARTMPIRVAGSMGQRSSRLGNGTTEETAGTSVLVVGSGGAVLAAVHLVGRREDAGAVLADLLEHLVDALLHHVLGAVDEEGDRVRVRLDPLDQVGVERELLTVQARHTDHGSVLWLGGGPRKRHGEGWEALFSSAHQGVPLSRTAPVTRGQASERRGKAAARPPDRGDRAAVAAAAAIGAEAAISA